VAAEDLSKNGQNEDYTKVVINELEILDIFHELQANNSRFLIWRKQKSPGEERVRVVTGILSSNLVEKEVVFIDLTSGNKLVENFGEESELFCFNPDKNILFKASIKELNVTKITLRFPNKVNIISAKNVKIILPELSDPKFQRAFGTKTTSSDNAKEITEELEEASSENNIEQVDQSTQESPQPAEAEHTDGHDQILIENEKLNPEHSSQEKHEEVMTEDDLPEDLEDYTAIRSAPRGKASGDQVVEIVFTSGPNTGEKGYYELYDLSVGGLSFIVFDENEVPMGTKVNITNLGGNEKRPPLKAEAVSFAEIDELSGEYKVGLKFS
tara:strand:+ start:1314 stop:2294 length:981 start_codon:yes stop_codon:yes gene_type:complete